MNALKSYCRTAEKETNQDKKDIFLLVFIFFKKIFLKIHKNEKKSKNKNKKNSGKTAAWNQSSRASAVSLVVKNELIR